MSAFDQLEVIDARGQVTFYDLDPARGVVNIGRDPSNDIVINSPDVAPFHAIVDHHRKPYQLVLLNREARTIVDGRPAAPGSAVSLSDRVTVELNGHALILLEGDGAPPPSREAGPVPAPALPSMGLVPAFSAFGPSDDIIVVEAPEREFTLEVEQSATFPVTVANGGDIVATFNIAIEGLDPNWVAVSVPRVNLFEGDRVTVTLTLTPPREPASRAGAHPFAVVVTSPNYPGRGCRLNGLLTIQPYFEYAMGEPSPKQPSIVWLKRSAEVTLPVSNKGNSPATFRLDALDDEHACRFEFFTPGNEAAQTRQAELRLQPDETAQVRVRLTPFVRQWVAWRDRNISFTVTTTPLMGQLLPRTVLGQLRTAPVIGQIIILLLAVLLAAVIVAIFRPTISYFGKDAAHVDKTSALIEAGEKLTLYWSASPFAKLEIKPDVGEVQGAEGSLSLAPADTTTYRLTASNWLTPLNPEWFGPTAEVRVVVGPVPPEIRLFKVDRNLAVVGESVNVSWDVDLAEEVLLLVNGTPETIPPGQYTGSRLFQLERDTTFTLQARNRYTTERGVARTEVVRVTPPTPTPLPDPVIERFDVQPSTITEGETVTLQWTVKGVDKVSISLVGDGLPPSGNVGHQPQKGTATYILSASNGQSTITSLREVIVKPKPVAPVVEFFTASPGDVAIGSPEALAVKLSWSVKGDVTNVQIDQPNVGIFANLKAQGDLTVSVAATTQFVLTAFNGDLSASKTAQVNAFAAQPVITALNPAAATAGTSAPTITVLGQNFLNGATVLWAGAGRPTTFVGRTQLNVALQAGDLAKAGAFAVTVVNPAPNAGTSAPANFIVANPGSPVITNLSPSTVVINSPDTPILVTGASFVSGSTVRWKNLDRPTTYLGPTQLSTTMPQSDLQARGSFQVTVFNPAPGGGLSNPFTFTVSLNNPLPQLLTINPTSTIAGGPPFTLVATGNNFASNAVIRWGGLDRATTYVSPNQITTLIPSSDIVNAGLITVTVFNPAPGGGVNPSFQNQVFEVQNPFPQITNITPASVVVGQAAQTLRITGLRFVNSPSTRVRWNSSFYTPTAITSSAITVTIPPGEFLTPGAALVQVINPAPPVGGQASNQWPVDVNPANTTVSVAAGPATVVFGQAVFVTATVSVNAPGSGAPQGTVTLFNSSGLPTAVSIVGNTAVFSATNFSVGALTVTARYNGDDPSGAYNASPISAAASVAIGKADTAVSQLVAAPAGLVTYGSSATFTATVSAKPPSSGSPPPAGTVSFYDDLAPLTPLATVPLVGNTATLVTTTLPAGTYNLRAQYNGDGNYNASIRLEPLPLPYLVNPVDTTTAVTASPASPADYGSTVTFTATVTPNTGVSTVSGGTVVFSGLPGGCSAGSGAPTGSPARFVVTCATPTVNTYNVTAQYVAGIGNFNSSPVSGLVTYQVVPAATTVTVTAAPPSPNTYPASITFTATVTANAGAGPVNVGTLTLNNLPSAPATCSAASGTPAGNPGRWAVTCSNVEAGAYNVTASYTGAGNFANGGPSAPLNYVVNGAPTFVTISVSAPTSTYSSTVTFTAQVTSTAGVVNVGTLTFTGLPAGCTPTSGAPVGGLLTATCIGPNAGAYNVTASYTGAGNFANGGPSSAASHTVNPAATSIVVTQSSATSTFGTAVTFTATVSSVAGPVNSGTVTFAGLSAAACSALSGTPVAGVFTATCTLNAGSYTINASYTGAGNFSSSGPSANVGHTVNPAATSVAVTVSSATSNFGSTVTFTATVTSAAGNVNAGTLTFSGLPAGCAPTTGAPTGTPGRLVSTCASPAVGTYNVTASYTGAGNFSSSGPSASVSHTVNPAPTNTTVTASAATSTYSSTVTFTAQVTSGAGAVNVGTLTFSGLPAGCAPTSGTPTGAPGQLVATCVGPGAGAYNVTASYTGAGSFASSGPSAAASHTVNPANTTTALTVSPTSGISTTTFNLTALITNTSSAVAPTGSVTFQYDAPGGGTTWVDIPTCTSVAVTGVSANSSQATCLNVLLFGFSGTGNYRVQAVYNPAPANFNTSSNASGNIPIT
jgi:hypothetical protein